MKPWRRLAERLRRSPRGWLAAGVFALTPKCLLCLTGYTGLGFALFGGPEICGGATARGAPWTLVFPLLGAAGVFGFLASRRIRRARPGSAFPGTSGSG